MRKKLLTIALCANLFIISCNKSDNNSENTGFNIESLTPEEINALPYGALTPEEQKVKLENDGSKLIELGDAAKQSKAVDATESLMTLLDKSPIELDGFSVRSVEDIFKYANYFGIYTWNKSKQTWDKADSDTELKIVFPSKKNGTTNDASLQATIKGTGKYVTITYTESVWSQEYGYKDIVKEKKVELPGTGTGVFAINGVEIGKVSLNATYGANEVPNTFNVEMNVDGYNLNCNFVKKSTNEVRTKLAYKESNMFDAVVKTDIKLDEIMTEYNRNGEDGNYYDYLKTVTAYINILDNLAVVCSGDMTVYAKGYDQINKEEDIAYDQMYDKLPGWDSPLRYPTLYSKAEELSKKFNGKRKELNSKLQMVLVSKLDGTKIAEIISEVEPVKIKYNEIWNEKNSSWEWKNTPQGEYTEYEEVFYLKFNDNTKVEIEAYIKGFTAFETKWKNFISAFERN